MPSQKSTTVRAPGGPTGPRAPAPVRFTLRTLEAVTPWIGAVLAEQLWFRLPPTPAPERRARHAPEGGEPFTVRWAGGSVQGVTYGPAGERTAYLVHGWGGWWQQLGGHVPALLDAGYRVVAYDAPSHGDSAPGRLGRRRSTVIEMAQAYGAVAGVHGSPHLVVAHSIGAVAVLRAGDVPPAAGYAFLAPASTFDDMVRHFARLLDLGPRSRQILLERVERRIGAQLATFDATVLAGELLARVGAGGGAADSRVPALLSVHDPEDAETTAQGSAGLVRDWPGAELVLVEGLGHRRLLWDMDVVATVAGFARRIPSG